MTFIELMATVSVIVLIGSVAMTAFNHVTDNVATTSLITHTKQLNSAVEIFEANGGRINGSDEMSTVLSKLKTAAQGSSRKQNAGLSGSMIDNRLVPVYQSENEASKSGSPRVVWNGDTRRFEIRSDGAAGIRSFVLKDAEQDGANESEEFFERDLTLKLAENSSWIWDYNSFSNPDGDAPDDFDQMLVIDRSAFPSNPSTGSMNGFGPIPLDPPLFSLDGGDFDYRDFNLEVVLTNPNPTDSSHLIFSVNEESWTEYSDGQVVLAAPSDTLRAIAISSNTSLYTDSEEREETYQSVFMISGSTQGEFSNPTGGSDMETGGSGNLFEWGTPYYYGGFTDPSWILFNGAEFTDVAPEERFVVGEVTYYNGTIYSGTGADSVDLGLELAFNDSESRDFEFTLDLVNTANTSDAWASADFVHLEQIYSAVSQSLGGDEYELTLEFGETTDQGYSSIRNFHVLEGGTATGVLYGTLVRVSEGL